MYGTTERDPATSHLRWRELKVAAVYEGKPSRLAPAPEGPENAPTGQPSPLPARVRVARWFRELDPEGVIAAPDQAKQVTYVAKTGRLRAIWLASVAGVVGAGAGTRTR